MCIGGGAPRMEAPIIPSDTGREAAREESLARRMMQMRAGAAANVLTSPSGIPGRPTSRTLGGVT